MIVCFTDDAFDGTLILIKESFKFSDVPSALVLFIYSLDGISTTPPQFLYRYTCIQSVDFLLRVLDYKLFQIAHMWLSYSRNCIFKYTIPCLTAASCRSACLV